MQRRVAFAFICALAAGCSSLAWDPATPTRFAREPGWTVAPNVTLVRQQTRSDCGAAALAMILRRWNMATGMAELRDALKSPQAPEGAIAAGRIRDLARQRGLGAFLIVGSTEDLAHELAQGRPVLVGVVRRGLRSTYTHYQVVVGVDGRRSAVLVADPDRGWREVSLASFAAEWEPANRLSIVFHYPHPHQG